MYPSQIPCAGKPYTSEPVFLGLGRRWCLCQAPVPQLNWGTHLSALGFCILFCFIFPCLFPSCHVITASRLIFLDYTPCPETSWFQMFAFWGHVLPCTSSVSLALPGWACSSGAMCSVLQALGPWLLGRWSNRLTVGCRCDWVAIMFQKSWIIIFFLKFLFSCLWRPTHIF